MTENFNKNISIGSGRSKYPRILAPAGSYDALCAAISAGADEVYFGASGFNARAGAKNFSRDEFAEAVKLCRVCNVSTNITVNTLLYDREIGEALELVYDAACLGADAFIVQDLGLASLIRREMPQVVLHASTQCACHNRDGARRLFEAGFSRIVLARELSAKDIAEISADGKNDYETEVFVHGALCVSHSGQCLFSSAVGGRSGNRGECAQPCRMEYSCLSCGNSRKGYPLSLKDLTLSGHIEELCASGAASLKIEGRMKSPEYVYKVTSIFKKLVSERRSASEDERKQLEELFSRGGFTDGYYTADCLKSNADMYGIRSEASKEITRKIEKNIVVPSPGAEISAVCSFEVGKKPSVTFKCGEFAACVCGEEMLDFAKNEGAAASFDSIAKNLLKLGGTPFELDGERIEMNLDKGVFVPASLVNNLRRNAAAELYEEITASVGIKRARIGFCPPKNSGEERQTDTRLYFNSPDGFYKKIGEYPNAAEAVFPLMCFLNGEDCVKISEISRKFKTGVLFPRVLFDSERAGALGALKSAVSCGAVFCEVSNIGHIEVVREAGLEVYGGVGLNITNSLSCEYFTDEAGMRSVVLSPELKFGALRDIAKKDGVRYCFYARGRLPLMVLESCIIKASGKCSGAKSGEKGRKVCVCASLKDRIGAEFPVCPSVRFNKERNLPCRNIIYNSVVTDLQRKKELYCCGLTTLCVSAENDGNSL